MATFILGHMFYYVYFIRGSSLPKSILWTTFFYLEIALRHRETNLEAKDQAVKIAEAVSILECSA